jgi:hypothetical protein
MEEEMQPMQQDEEEEPTVDEIAVDNQAKIDALVELLVNKGIIREEEFDQAYDDQFEDDAGEQPQE